MSYLEIKFNDAMDDIAKYSISHGFGIRFKQMIKQYGAVDTAKRLLATQEIQAGLMRLWELESLDKSMEALVDQERFHYLFSQEEIAEAHRRLYELGYFKENP